MLHSIDIVIYIQYSYLDLDENETQPPDSPDLFKEESVQVTYSRNISFSIMARIASQHRYSYIYIQYSYLDLDEDETQPPDSPDLFKEESVQVT